MNRLPITESELHAYVDGLLPESRRREVEEYLAGRPEEAERIRTYAQHAQDLRELFAPVMDEPVPRRLSAYPRSRLRAFGNHGAGWGAKLAASLAIAFVSGSAGWALHGMKMENQVAGGTVADAGIYDRPGTSGTSGSAMQAAGLPRQAAIAHVVYSPDVRRPVEVGAEQEEQLVAWLSKRIGTPIRPPKLGKLGFELIGGRLLPGGSGPVAQFMYHDLAGQRLTLYVSTEQAQNKDTGFRFAQEGPVNVFYWIDGKFGYALSAGIDKGSMAKLASAVYEQLEIDGKEQGAR